MRAGDILVVACYVGAAIAVGCLLCIFGGWCAGVERIESAVATSRRWLALRIGGRHVQPAGHLDGGLRSKLERILDSEEGAPVGCNGRGWDDCEGGVVGTGPAPWTWADRPAYVSYSDWARFVGTTDPLPDPREVAALDGVGVGETGDDDEPGRPDPSVILPDDCPGKGCPSRYQTAGEADEAGWEMVAQVAPEDAPPGYCCLVYCQRCESPNPTFRVRCHKCGSHLATGEPLAMGGSLADAVRQSAWEGRNLADVGAALVGEPGPAMAVAEHRTESDREAYQYPTVKQLAKYLSAVKRATSWSEDMADEEGNVNMDVRLNVQRDGWTVNTGDSSYDQDHRGLWGAGYLDPRTNTRDLARELIEEAREQEAAEVGAGEWAGA